jgi:hypothetical protein
MDTQDLWAITDTIHTLALDLDVVLTGSGGNLSLLNEGLWKNPVRTVRFGPTAKLTRQRGPVFSNTV